MPYSLSKPRFIRVPLQIVKKSLIEHLTNISVNMELIKKKVSELIPYINNSRTHSEEQVTQIVSSIKEFGFTNPILIDKDNSIIAGHGRLQAVKRLGLEEVPCILISGLTKTQIKALIIADNQLALNAGWDLEKLSVEIEGLEEDKFDLSLLGFDDKFLDDLLFKENEGLTDEDAVPELKENPKSKLGDIFILGNHRLMCGDSTNINSVNTLMKNDKANMIFTDPPYGINYQDIKKNHTKIANDESLLTIPKLLENILSQDCPIFVCCNWKCYSAFENEFINKDKHPKSCIVWDKKTRIQNLDRFFKQHEFIIYYGLFGNQKTVDGDVWRIDRETRKDHPTAKPVALIEKAINYTILKNQIVQDLYLGSGSTIIASEKTGTKCYGMELDPKYCDVIIQRWQQFTGKEAIHEQSGKTYNSI